MPILNFILSMLIVFGLFYLVFCVVSISVENMLDFPFRSSRFVFSLSFVSALFCDILCDFTDVFTEFIEIYNGKDRRACMQNSNYNNKVELMKKKCARKIYHTIPQSIICIYGGLDDTVANAAIFSIQYAHRYAAK